MRNKEAIATFLADTEWRDAQLAPLGADASHRRYSRLFDMQRGAQALVMDAPPALEPKTGDFVTIATWLRTHGFSAPNILKVDLDQGLLLLEDFGEGSYGACLSANPAREAALYLAAGDVVAALPANNPPTLAPYDATELAREVALFSDCWWPNVMSSAMESDTRTSFEAAWSAPLAFLEEAARQRPTLTLRDFHKDNLFDLPARSGLARVGLIDFQDGLIGHAAYDLVSLLQDVRLTVSPDVQSETLARVVAQLDDPDFEAAYALYGAQRAFKIIGIFVRLDVVHGKPGYRVHLERTWHRAAMNLAHDMLRPLRHWIAEHIPADHRFGVSLP